LSGWMENGSVVGRWILCSMRRTLCGEKEKDWTERARWRLA